MKMKSSTSTRGTTYANDSLPSSSSTKKVISVTTQRKHQLLMEARKARIKWVQSSSFPFILQSNEIVMEKQNQESETEQEERNSNVKNKNDPLNEIKTICNHIQLSSAIPIIESLLLSSQVSSDSIVQQNHNDNEQHPAANIMEMSKKWNHTILQYKQRKSKALQEHNHQSNNNNDNYEVEYSPMLMSKTNDHAFLFYYKEVLDKLCLPECADIVQNMRHFERSFIDLSTQLLNNDSNNNNNNAKKDKNDSNQNNNQEHLKTLSNTIHKYLSKFYVLLSTHSAWRDNGISSHTKMMLETFIYSKCYNSIQPILQMTFMNEDEDDIAHAHDDNTHDDNDVGKNKNNNSENENNNNTSNKKNNERNHAKNKLVLVCNEEKLMNTKLEFLQFVQPKHLDMHSIVSNDGDSNGDSDHKISDCNEKNDSNDLQQEQKHSWKTQIDLSKPISDIQSLDNMYSPAQMIRCILEIYRGVNDALSKCLLAKSKGSSNVSADDLLPSLILSIIHAKPKRIISVLKFLDIFATNEQLRGEAGYAFTHLYSAVQFIKELDFNFDDNDSSCNVSITDEKCYDTGRVGVVKPKLSMPHDILQKMLHSFRQKLTINVKSRDEGNCDIDEIQQHDTAKINTKIKNANEENYHINELFQRIEIPLNEIKAAQQRGEDLRDWVTSWVEENNKDLLRYLDDDVGLSSPETLLSPVRNTAPDGFLRSYKYLATDPKEVKISDIPELLEEYKMLVQISEDLIMTRNSYNNLKQQKDINTKRRNLESLLKEVMKSTH